MEKQWQESCRLLGRLVRLAGERDMAAWLPESMARRLGFVRAARETFRSRTTLFYVWDRNGYWTAPG
jgi:hypothetical protein